MGNEELKAKITELLASATFEDGGEWLNIVIAPADWLPLAKQLRNDTSLQFDFLFCVTCIDWAGPPVGKTHLTMVYHLRSTNFRHDIVVRATLDRINPEIQSVVDIWRTAEFHEREDYEMFGVNFLNHPDLRLLILPDVWEGNNPQRKSFEDEGTVKNL